MLTLRVQALYVTLNNMVFYSDEANAAKDLSDLILRLHVSHFAWDMDDFESFIDYHGGEDTPFVQRMIGILESFTVENKRLPFNRWQGLDPNFKDLVGKMTCMDPRRRITAAEALRHPYFGE